MSSLYKILPITLSLMTFNSYAFYPGFNNKSICNGYPTQTGIITKISSTVISNGYSAVYLELTSSDNRKFGGRIYPVDDAPDWGYNPLVNSAYMAFLTKTKVTACFYYGDETSANDDIYALELSN
ncbi:hypothetical protein [Pseudomonas chlororaphis]|uniref:hypothetical protein n=1 Tax=Pseudomonas chlororaphis TaxID=587753 RepID=UPI000F58AD3E|nr:hypothetical protein [Pseudomonas chlororaphis]WDG71552.1 hypothetical protein PUP65_26170 [Pseudomonas chlororaphis]WDH30664.1 hypothetical protein PUP81_08150 [Pseudomonas chlororaphis]WDH70077.1 hypothetical protein PUP78_26155 [Pseudomonas chlororaphis]